MGLRRLGQRQQLRLLLGGQQTKLAHVVEHPDVEPVLLVVREPAERAVEERQAVAVELHAHLPCARELVVVEEGADGLVERDSAAPHLDNRIVLLEIPGEGVVMCVLNILMWMKLKSRCRNSSLFSPLRVVHGTRPGTLSKLGA
jgi:hypothetical protein